MKYYVYNMRTNTLLLCESLEELIRWCSRHNYETGHHQMKNSLFDDLSLNFNDKKVAYYWDKDRREYAPCLVPREVIIFDENDRIIDIRQYKEEIFRYTWDFFGFCRQTRKFTDKFRNGPVSNIRSKSKKRGKYCRHPYTTNERRLSCDPELKDYIRPKRSHKNLVHAWDEIPRHLDKCWKNKKIKRQWMKHLK